MMRAVVTEGACNFLLDVPGEPVLAKSGTAQFGGDDDAPESELLPQPRQKKQNTMGTMAHNPAIRDVFIADLLCLLPTLPDKAKMPSCRRR
jgi:cell division protein FtsI/penicillin-binding protein 2